MCIYVDACVLYIVFIYCMSYNAYRYLYIYIFMHTSFFIPMCCAMWYGSLVSSIGWCWMISWYVVVFVFCYCRLLRLLFVVLVVCCLCCFLCLLLLLLFFFFFFFFFLIWLYQWVKVTRVFDFHVPLSLLTHRFEFPHPLTVTFPGLSLLSMEI